MQIIEFLTIDRWISITAIVLLKSVHVGEHWIIGNSILKGQSKLFQPEETIIFFYLDEIIALGKKYRVIDYIRTAWIPYIHSSVCNSRRSNVHRQSNFVNDFKYFTLR